MSNTYTTYIHICSKRTLKMGRSFGRLIMHPFSLVLFRIFCMIIFRDKFGCILQHEEIEK